MQKFYVINKLKIVSLWDLFGKEWGQSSLEWKI